MVALAHGCRLMSRRPVGQVAQGCIHRWESYGVGDGVGVGHRYRC